MNIVKIQRFSTHDGSGIRTVVFLKGCPLRCKWCHNPETQLAQSQILYQKTLCIACRSCENVCKNQAHIFDSSRNHIFDVKRCSACLSCADVCPTGAIEIAGKQMSGAEIIEQVKRDSAFYGANGGLTVSGGEPMFQPEDTIELLSLAKENNISTAVETCGYFSEKYIEPLSKVCDTFLWDFKAGSTETHWLYTGVGNKKIIANLFSADALAKNIILRCIMVKGVNMDDENLAILADTQRKLKHCGGVQLLPYHAYGGSKMEQLGGCDNGNKDWIPSDEDLEKAENYLISKGVNII